MDLLFTLHHDPIGIDISDISSRSSLMWYIAQVDILCAPGNQLPVDYLRGYLFAVRTSAKRITQCGGRSTVPAIPLRELSSLRVPTMLIARRKESSANVMKPSQ